MEDGRRTADGAGRAQAGHGVEGRGVEGRVARDRGDAGTGKAPAGADEMGAGTMTADGWGSEAEREECRHVVVGMSGPGGLRTGLMVMQGERVRSRHWYRQEAGEALTLAEVQRVRDAAEASARHLTGRSVRWYRTCGRARA